MLQVALASWIQHYGYYNPNEMDKKTTSLRKDLSLFWYALAGSTTTGSSGGSRLRASDFELRVDALSLLDSFLFGNCNSSGSVFSSCALDPVLVPSHFSDISHLGYRLQSTQLNTIQQTHASMHIPNNSSLGYRLVSTRHSTFGKIRLFWIHAWAAQTGRFA